MASPVSKGWREGAGHFGGETPTSELQSRRFVSFAEEEVLGSTEAFVAKYGEFGPDQNPVDQLAMSTPTWLLQDGAAATGSTEDIMDEFLTDDDMLRLEVECFKWYDLSDEDLKAISKLDNDLAKQLLECHKDMTTFLRYRQQLNEKHARKASVKQSVRRRTMMPGQEDVILEEENEDEDEECSDEDEEWQGPPAASTAPKEEARQTRVGADGLSAKALRKRSMVRRPSISAKLARAGSHIAGQASDDAVSDSTIPAKESVQRSGRRPTLTAESGMPSPAGGETPSLRSRKSVLGLKPITLPQVERARRMSVLQKSGSDMTSSSGVDTMASIAETPKVGKVQSNSSDSLGGGRKSIFRRNAG